ncbi:patched domain-containing protein 3-like [Centruroides vittatus]|uniref:patched domain-containing protein 3-like n=1 Tax=Centruroides vittatus TaxID=120091 RepID=UPI0035101A87
MKHKNISKNVSTALSRIGYHIGCYPQLYVAVPFILSLLLSTGLLNISLQRDTEYLYISSNARSRIDRAAIESIFPTNTSQCDYRRISRFEAVAVIIVTPKNRTSVFEELIIEDVIKLDEIIKNVTILWSNSFLRYEDLCCKTERNTCVENFPLSLKGKTNDIKKGIYEIRYPTDILRDTIILSAFQFGGVTLNEKSLIRDSYAIRLGYVMDRTTKEKKQMALKWEKSVSCLSTDAVTSKPWLGIAGCVSPFLATVAAFGLLCYCKMDYSSLNVVIFFLVSAIHIIQEYIDAGILMVQELKAMNSVGIDDAFILIAAWRRTDVNASVPDRMKDAYAEAAVSITITSLTNLLAFCIGFVTPYKCIHIFSAYSALAIVFDYIFQLLFFGGLMTLDGYIEKIDLHSFFCWRTERIHRKPENGIQVITNQNNKENICMVFFSNAFGEILGRLNSKSIVIIMFTLYLTGAIYCMKFIQEGEDISKLYSYSSYAREYINLEYRYFSNYSHQVQIVVNQTLDYSNVTIQNDVEDLLQSFESAPFISDSSATESWLREFLAFIKSPVAKFSLSGYNLSDSEDFLSAFQNVFLKAKVANRLRNDVIFNEEGDKITSCRFIVSSFDGESRIDEKFFLENVRKIADDSKLPVIAYNFRFIYDELGDNILSNSIKAISSAAAIVIFVFLLFTSNILFLLSVAISILSIQVGLIGYMSLWNVSINTTTLITLVMCTGFCVDYTVHSAYAFINCEMKTPNEKIKSCLYATGYPVTQACISTLLSVSVLYFGPSESFVVFSKIITLMVIFALFHSLVILPVILSLFDFISSSLKNSKRMIKHKENDLPESNL